MEVVNHRSSNETIVHFVNFDDKRTLAPFSVHLKRQMDGKIKSVSLFTPESDEPKKLLFTEQNGQVHFTVPAMKRYSMVVVSQTQ
jgi:hypothetical protein